MRFVRVAPVAVLTVLAIAFATPGNAAAAPVDITHFQLFASEFTGPVHAGSPIAAPAPGGLQAAGHQNLTASFWFCDEPTNGNFDLACPTPKQQGEDAKKLTINAPPGAIANPQATQTSPGASPYCRNEDFVADNCPASTIVGRSDSWVDVELTPANPPTPATHLGVELVNQPVYNVQPQGSEIGRLGSIAQALPGTDKVYLPTLFTFRSQTDNGLDAVNLELPNTTVLAGTTLQVKVKRIDFTEFGFLASGKPFVDNPTNCDAGQATISANSFQEPGSFNFATPPSPVTATNCAAVPFDPTADFDADSLKAGATSGYTVAIDVPGADVPLRRSHLKRSTTVLPVGSRLNPTAAKHLDSCSDDQFGYGLNQPVHCPPASDIGNALSSSLSIDADPLTPVVDPLVGDIYFAKALPNNKWRIFVVVEGGGLRVRLRGITSVDPSTGQLTTVFDDSPQLPFTRFELKFRGGDDAVLLNPDTCGTQTMTATMRPYSGTADVVDSASIDTTYDGTPGSGCPAVVPFAPTVDVSTDTHAAGAHPNLKVQINRPDGDQQVKALNMSLPAGLVGKLRGVPKCGSADAAAGTCPADSRVGGITANIGTSPGASMDFPGTVYLADPIAAGEPASLAIVVPAKAGPIDLGNQVIRAGIRLRQDGGLDVVAASIPTMIDGVPIPLRKATIDIDRKGFIVNPTGCESRELRASFNGKAPYGPDLQSSGGGSYQATGCENLGFAPKIAFFTGGKGQTGNESHPPLRTVVTVGDGQAALKRTVVTLPDVFRPDTVNINKAGLLCQQPQGDLGSCPAASRIGTATADSPLLPDALSGPVYAIQTAPGQLPKIGVLLQGAVTLELYGQSSLNGVRTVTDFDATPDVPLTRFELAIDGGPNGILKTRGSLCSGAPAADVAFTGQNGATSTQRPLLSVAGCSKLSIVKRSLRVSRGTVSIPVKCEVGECSGTVKLAGKKRRKPITLGSKKYSLKEAQSAKVKVKLTKAAKRLVAKSRRLNVSVSADSSGVEIKQATSLKGTKKTKKKRRSKAS